MLVVEMLWIYCCVIVLVVCLYLLCIELVDWLGSFGLLVVVFGLVGVDIFLFDVVECGNGYVIDDLVVELFLGVMFDMLIIVVEVLNGVWVDSVCLYIGLLEVYCELELFDYVVVVEGVIVWF